mmetsp:Transcript_25362/g.60333  ORF Transcript_25362/g.60333 Transcript_25362/m.60333 type:complete len:261 (-) Transcript_25362:6-788(-)
MGPSSSRTGEPARGVGGQEKWNSLGSVSLLVLCFRPALLRSVACSAFRQFIWFRRIIAFNSWRFCMTSKSSSSLELRIRLLKLFRDSCVRRDTTLASENTLKLAEHTEALRSSSSKRFSDREEGERPVAGVRVAGVRAVKGARCSILGVYGVQGPRAVKGAGVLATGSSCLRLFGVAGRTGVFTPWAFAFGNLPFTTFTTALGTFWFAFSSCLRGDSKDGRGDSTKYWHLVSSLRRRGELMDSLLGPAATSLTCWDWLYK